MMHLRLFRPYYPIIRQRTLGMSLFTNSAVFFNIIQNAFDPPPLTLLGPAYLSIFQDRGSRLMKFCYF